MGVNFIIGRVSANLLAVARFASFERFLTPKVLLLLLRRELISLRCDWLPTRGIRGSVSGVNPIVCPCDGEHLLLRLVWRGGFRLGVRAFNSLTLRIAIFDLRVLRHHSSCVRKGIFQFLMNISCVSGES